MWCLWGGGGEERELDVEGEKGQYVSEVGREEGEKSRSGRGKST